MHGKEEIERIDNERHGIMLMELKYNPINNCNTRGRHMVGGLDPYNRVYEEEGRVHENKANGRVGNENLESWVPQNINVFLLGFLHLWK